MGEIKKYPFPTEQTLSNKFCEKNFWKCLYDSAADILHYWIILPNNVKPIEVRPVKTKNATVIGHYIGVDGPYLEVFVMYEYCEFEMNVSDWAEKKLIKMGELVVNHRLIEGRSTGTYLDALTSRKLNEEETVISRVTTLKDSVGNGNGANYFMAIARCKEENYEELSNTILQIVTNWDLTNKSQWQFGELLQKFSYPVNDKVEFYVPLSWEMGFDESSIHTSTPRFVISHLKDEQNGVINVFFHQSNTKKSYAEIAEMFIERLKNLKGYKTELKQFETVKLTEIKNPFIYSMYRTTGSFENDGLDFHAHVQVVIIKMKKGWYYFDLIGSKPDLDSYNWEVNKRCLELIIKSFNNLEFEETDDA